MTTIVNPPGYSGSSGGSTGKQSKQQVRDGPTKEESDTLKVKKAWDIAIAPAKSMPMQAFMMYMSGSSPQIFSMMMTFMFLSTPFKAIASMNQQFSRFDSPTTGGRLLLPKIAFVLLQILTVAVGVWKCSSMGLLPTHRSDWLAWETQRPYMETFFRL